MSRCVVVACVAASGLAVSANALARPTVSWGNAAGGSWATPTNWAGNAAPTFADDALIDLLGGGPYTVTIAGASSAASLTLNSVNATVSHSSGTLSLNGGLLNLLAGTYTLTGGTLSNATIAGNAFSTPAGGSGTLSNVVLDTTLNLNSGYTLNIASGLTINAGRTLSVNAGGGFTIMELLGAGNQTLGGGGEIVFNGTSSNAFVRANSGTLVIGAGTTVRSGTQGGSVGQFGMLTNQGTIASRTNLRTVNVGASSGWTNDATGTLEASNGGTLTLNNAWTNLGTLFVNGGTLNLAGTFSTPSIAPARWNRTGGTVSLTGTLNNTANTLVLDAQTGSMELRGGTINGGTITTSGGALLTTPANSSGTFSGGVTLDGDMSIGPSYTLNVNGGLTVNAGRTLTITTGAGFTVLDMLGAGQQSIGGGGDVVFDGTSPTTGFVRANAGTLVVDQNTTIRSGTQGGNVGQFGSLLNNGTIASRTTGRTVSVTGTSAWSNSPTGTLEASNGGTLTITGPWTNTGTLKVDGGTMNLGGTFFTSSVAPDRWNRTGGTVNLTGAVTNTGNTLNLNAQTGSFELRGGTVNGGTIATSGGAALTTATGQSGTFSGGVTLDTDMTLAASYALNVNGGLTINPGRTLTMVTGNGFTVLEMLGAGNQSIGGGGEVVFDGANTNAFARANSGTLVIGQNTTVRTGTQGGNVGQFGSMTNQGTIASRTNGATLVAGTTGGWTNDTMGTLEASNGGTLTLTNPWTNAGTLKVDGGTMNLGGSYATAAIAPARWNRTGGTVNLTGSLNNGAGTLLLNAQTGSMNLMGGTITGGTIATANGASLMTTGSGGTFSGGVTLDTDMTLAASYTLSVNGGLTINAGRTLSLASGNGFSVLDLLAAGDQTVGGGGEVVFDGASGNSFVRANAGTLVIGAGTTVRSGAHGGSVGQSGSVRNEGTIRSQTSGRTVTIAGTNIDNAGTILVENGGTLTVLRSGGLSSNTGTLTARTGGRLSFSAGLTASTNGPINLELASASQTVGYGRITVTGNASISGSDINLMLTGGFNPDWGDTFNILTYGALLGDMSSLVLPTLSDPVNLRWWRTQTASAFTIGVRILADTNHDGAVDFLDLNNVLSFFGQSGAGLAGDADENGVVDFFDLNYVLSDFGRSAPINPVPAPAGAALAMIGFGLTGGRRRKTS